MASVQLMRFKKLNNKLASRIERVRVDRNVSVRVSYATRYAVYVHEDLTMNHPRGGQAKFLEEAVNNTRDEVRQLLYTWSRRGVSLGATLRQCGRIIRSESLRLVPVDTGLLRSTARVILERGGRGGS